MTTEREKCELQIDREEQRSEHLNTQKREIKNNRPRYIISVQSMNEYEGKQREREREREREKQEILVASEFRFKQVYKETGGMSIEVDHTKRLINKRLL